MSNYMCVATFVVEKSLKTTTTKILLIVYSACHTTIGVVLRHNSISTHSNSAQIHSDQVYINTSSIVSYYMCTATLVIEKSHNLVPKILVIVYYAYFTEIGVVWRHNFTNTYPNSTQIKPGYVYIYIIDCVKSYVCQSV